MSNKLLFKKISLSVISLVLLICLLMVSASPAFAKQPAPGTNPVVKGPSDKQLSATLHRYTSLFQRLRDRGNFQNVTLAQAQKLIAAKKDRVTTTTATSGSRARDLQRITAQLDALTANINRVNQLRDVVRNLIDTHSGFDSNGEVTNHDMAVESLKNIQKALADLQYYTKRASTGFNQLIRAN